MDANFPNCSVRFFFVVKRVKICTNLHTPQGLMCRGCIWMRVEGWWGGRTSHTRFRLITEGAKCENLFSGAFHRKFFLRLFDNLLPKKVPQVAFSANFGIFGLVPQPSSSPLTFFACHIWLFQPFWWLNHFVCRFCTMLFVKRDN